MIKNIHANGKYTRVDGGYTPPTQLNGHYGTLGSGNVRFNAALQNFEVFDGFVWITMNSNYAGVGLSFEAEQAIDWARAKMTEEMEIAELAKINPTIAALVSQANTVHEKIKVVMTLIKNEDTIVT